MKHHLIILCLVAFSFGASNLSSAATLYGATSAGAPGELFILDKATGAVITDIGPLNDSDANNYSVTGLAFDPTTGVLYGSTGGHTGTELLTIDPATALVTVVGDYNTGVGGNTMADIAFDSAGNLYGISSVGGANLYTIDINTGQATEVAASGLSFTAGGGLAISSSGVFFCTPQTTEFGTMDPTTGAYTHIADPARPAGNSASYGSLAFDGNTLYGMDLGGPPHLVIFDLAGNVTDLGTSTDNIDAIAFQETTNAPVTLTIQESGNSVMLSWPASAGDYYLQQTTDLSAANWGQNNDTVTTSGGTNHVTISSLSAQMFYRLGPQLP
jgi:hypothetical protein